MKKFCSIFAVILCCSFSGCGYQIGNLGHPQLKSVAVAPVINDTLAYNASAVLRKLLSERFTTDGTMKLESVDQADCIVYARIKDVTYQALDYGTLENGDDSILANEWNCAVTVEYSLILPGRGKPLINSQSVTGSSRFLNGPNMETSRENAMHQALFAAVKSMVSSITEGW